MSLYDDIITSSDKGDSIKDSRPSDWSGIKLLETHLLSKKKNQPKRENVPRRPVNSFGGPGFGFKTKTIVDETPISTILDYHGKNTNGSLLGGDWDVTQEYDPLSPNDYEKIFKEKGSTQDKAKLEIEKSRDSDDHDKRRRTDKLPNTAIPSSTSGIIVNPTGSTMFARSLVDAYSDDEEEDVKPYSGLGRSAPPVARGAAIAPPPSLIESTVVKSVTNEIDISTTNSSSGPKGSVAAKIMARMGYKEGQGLGKEEQGISRALEVEKTSKRGGKIIAGTSLTTSSLLPPPPPPPPQPSSAHSSFFMQPEMGASSSTESTGVESITELMKNPTKVVLLRNMVGPGEVDEDLEPEVKEECSKYGEVVKCVIYEIHGGNPEDAVRIFVEFKRVEAAIKAVVDLNGRYFGGRIVKISFYDVEKFKRLELND